MSGELKDTPRPRDERSIPRLLLATAIYIALFIASLLALVVPMTWAYDGGLRGLVVYASGMLGVLVYVLIMLPLARFLKRHDLVRFDEI